MGADNLSALLCRERELLELLVLKLGEEQLMLTGGRFRWLRHAVREVEDVLVQLQTTGVERADAVSAVAVEWGLGEGGALGQLAGVAPNDACRGVLQAHLTAVTALTAQIADLHDKNLTYLGAATRSTMERLATAVSAEQAAGPVGPGVPADIHANGSTYLFDRQG